MSYLRFTVSMYNLPIPDDDAMKFFLAQILFALKMIHPDLRFDSDIEIDEIEYSKTAR